MNSNSRLFDLQEISQQELLNIRHSNTKELILLRPEHKNLSESNVRELNLEETSHLRAAFYWINLYTPEPNTSKLEQVRGYLEAFYHLCQIEAWEFASRILFLNIDSHREILFHEQLGIWGYHPEQTEVYKPLLGKINSQIDCLCLLGLGKAYRYMGNLNIAIEYHKELLTIARTINNKKMQSLAFGEIGINYRYIGKLDTAFFYYQQQLKIARIIENKIEQSNAFIGLSMYFYNQDSRQCLKVLKKALTIMNGIKKREEQILISIINISTILVLVKKNKEAKKLLKSINQSEFNKLNPFYQSIMIGTLGQVCFCLKEYQEALKYFQEALKIHQKTRAKLNEGTNFHNMGIVYAFGLKDYKNAIRYFALSLKIARKSGNLLIQPVDLACLSYCYACLKESKLAKKYSLNALALARKVKNKHAYGMALGALGQVYWSQGKYFKGVLIATKGILILKPWSTMNGKMMLDTMIGLVTNKVLQIIRSLTGG